MLLKSAIINVLSQHKFTILILNYNFFFFIVDTSWPEESYGGISTDNKRRAVIDRASLPTAPRASRGPDIDVTKVPEGPPYTAFLGNLSYDVDRDDIIEFFGNKKVCSRCSLLEDKRHLYTRIAFPFQ